MATLILTVSCVTVIRSRGKYSEGTITPTLDHMFIHMERGPILGFRRELRMTD
jgi:hypothetical protein